MDKLALAVAKHETCGCTCGIVDNVKPDGVNNCFGIKAKGGGNRNYASQHEAFEDFKALWNRAYGGFPTMKTASKYVGHDGCGWIKGVSRAYNAL